MTPAGSVGLATFTASSDREVVPESATLSEHPDHPLDDATRSQHTRERPAPNVVVDFGTNAASSATVGLLSRVEVDAGQTG